MYLACTLKPCPLVSLTGVGLMPQARPKDSPANQLSVLFAMTVPVKFAVTLRTIKPRPEAGVSGSQLLSQSGGHVTGLGCAHACCVCTSLGTRWLHLIWCVAACAQAPGQQRCTRLSQGLFNCPGCEGQPAPAAQAGWSVAQ